MNFAKNANVSIHMNGVRQIMAKMTLLVVKSKYVCGDIYSSHNFVSKVLNCLSLISIFK